MPLILPHHQHSQKLDNPIRLSMTLSTRVYIQRPPDEPREDTHTMVLTSPQNHFVDVRILVEKYPYVQPSGEKPTLQSFNEVFDWVMTGMEVPIGNNKVHFKHDINLKEVVESEKSGKPLDQCKDEEDVGEFEPVEGSSDRKETGISTHPETGKLNPYVEIWRSLDPEKYTPKEEIIENPGQPEHGYVLEVVEEGFKGKIVQIGNWVQGVVYGPAKGGFPMSVMRRFFDGEEWVSMIEYGVHEFPRGESSRGEFQKGQTVGGSIKWKCVESF